LELRACTKRLGITMVYVTHDQSEALTMSDRIAVFHLGRIQQVADPQTIYERRRTCSSPRSSAESNRCRRNWPSRTGDGRCTARLADGTLLRGLADGAPAARPGGALVACGRSASR